MAKYRLTPWINEGLYGFFEYELWYRDLNIHARTLDEIKTKLSLEIYNKNTDRLYCYKNDLVAAEYDKLSDEEKKNISISVFQSNFVSTPNPEIEKMLMDNGTLYPWNVELDDCEIQHYDPTEEDLSELRYILEMYPDITQMELENIYFEHVSTDPKYLVNQVILDSSEASVAQDDKDTAVSDLLCELYEKQLQSEEIILSQSESIIDLYEKLYS